MKLSVVIPAYNEINTIEEILFRVQEVELDKEIIIVDDGSTDGTKEFLVSLQKSKGEVRLEKIDKFINVENIRVFFQPGNMGKGAANSHPHVCQKFKSSSNQGIWVRVLL